MILSEQVRHDRRKQFGRTLYYALLTTSCLHRSMTAGPYKVRGHDKPCDDEMVRPSYSTSLQGLPLAKMVRPPVAF